MRFQPVKCNIIRIVGSNARKQVKLYPIEGTVLDKVEKIKYLGITIANDLKWNT